MDAHHRNVSATIETQETVVNHHQQETQRIALFDQTESFGQQKQFGWFSNDFNQLVTSFFHVFHQMTCGQHQRNDFGRGETKENIVIDAVRL